MFRTQGLQHPDPIPYTPPPCRLSLFDPRVVKRYNKIVRQEFARHNLPAKIFALQCKINQIDSARSHKFNQLLTLDFTIRKLAQRKCRKLRMGKHQFSDVLKRHSQEVHLWTLLRKRRLGLRVGTKKIRRLSRSTDIPNVFQYSFVDIDAYRRTALAKYKQVKRDSAIYAHAFHQRLLRDRASKFGTSSQAQASILRSITKQRTTARRIKGSLVPLNPRSASSKPQTVMGDAPSAKVKTRSKKPAFARDEDAGNISGAA